MAARSYGQYCGVTTAVELVTERWALLIIRDLCRGAARCSRVGAQTTDGWCGVCLGIQSASRSSDIGRAMK